MAGLLNIVVIQKRSKTVKVPVGYGRELEIKCLIFLSHISPIVHDRRIAFHFYGSIPGIPILIIGSIRFSLSRPPNFSKTAVWYSFFTRWTLVEDNAEGFYNNWFCGVTSTRIQEREPMGVGGKILFWINPIQWYPVGCRAFHPRSGWF